MELRSRAHRRKRGSRLIAFQIEFGQRPKKGGQILIQDKGASAVLFGFEQLRNGSLYR